MCPVSEILTKKTTIEFLYIFLIQTNVSSTKLLSSNQTSEILIANFVKRKFVKINLGCYWIFYVRL